ncbi:hypothetical protein MUU49_17430 [Scandinavium goeteborgense]|uniref:phage baseplate protein n=1 Tax=Scandinavium goeteborgense TaxID=1851514 RepID=UPI00216604F4|nr:hypothetical protein [Scandinavium goeteborgense]MCS2154340.1 hypothetical protein [Scandinavium goeteborgense]
MTQGIRPDGQIFASEANDGELENFPAPLRGWGVTTDGKDEADNIVTEATNGIPPMEWDNGQRNKVDNNIWWLMQHAIPEWQAGTWDAGAFVRCNDVVYYNATDAETAVEPGNSTDWSAVLPLKGTDGRYLQVNNNLSEIAAGGSDAQTTARENLALGDLATKDVSTITQLIYPVGAVITNTGTNPADYLGFGTWVARAGSIRGVGAVTDSAGMVQTLNAGIFAGYWRVQSGHVVTANMNLSGGTTASAGGHAHGNGQCNPGNWNDADLYGSRAATDAGKGWSVGDGSTALQCNTSSDGAHTHSVTGSVTFGSGSTTSGSAMINPGYHVHVWERTA